MSSAPSEPNPENLPVLGQKVQAKLRALATLPGLGEKGIWLLLRVAQADPEWKVRARAYEVLPL